MSARSSERCLTKWSGLRVASNSVCLEQHCSTSSLCPSSLSCRKNNDSLVIYSVRECFSQQRAGVKVSLQDVPNLSIPYIFYCWHKRGSGLTVSLIYTAEVIAINHKATVLTVAWMFVDQSPACAIHFSCSSCSWSIYMSNLSRPERSSECQTHCWSHSSSSPVPTDGET